MAQSQARRIPGPLPALFHEISEMREVSFNKNTPHVELAMELENRGHNVLLVNYQPTSEMMVIDFAKKIKAKKRVIPMPV